MLSVLRQIVCAAERHTVPLTLCGEMAGHPLGAMALIGVGFERISMSPASVGPVKSMVLALDRQKLMTMLLPLLEQGDVDVQAALENFAEEHEIPL